MLETEDNQEIRLCLEYNSSVDNFSHMLHHDLLKELSETDDDGVSKFERKAQECLEKSIDEGGYNWKDAHLKISSKLHLKDFIYGKKLFQRSRYASGFAFLLSQDIFKQIISNENTKNKCCYTLIGYGYYSELLVSQTCEFIREHFRQHNINNNNNLLIDYIIMKDEEEMDFSRYFQNLKNRNTSFENANERLIIVVPISSTLTTCLKIENSLSKQLKKEIEDKKDDIKWNVKLKNVFEQNENNKVFIQPFYTIVIVSDDIEYDKLVEDWEKNTLEGQVLKESRVWKNIKKNRIIITQNRDKNNLDRDRENKFKVFIKSKWFLPKDCEFCFPKYDPKNEKPLFKTDKVSVTPSLIFDNPHWYEYNNEVFFSFKNEENTQLDSMYSNCYPILKYNMVDWAHYESAHKLKHYAYYIHYLSVIKSNENGIIEWAKERKDYIGKLSNILLIAPDKNENGAFIHLINRFVFDNKANIIKFDKSSDCFINFNKFINNSIDTKDISIFFVDNLMASSNTFLSINEDVVNAFNIILKNGNKIKIKGVFCLINRMDYVCYTNVQNALSSENNIFAYMQLNVPENLNPHIFCPLCKAEVMWNELTRNASCDCIKRYIIDNEKLYFKKITKNELTMRRFPYSEEKDNNKTLLKIMLIHFIYKAFSNKEDEAIKIANYLNGNDTDTTFNNFIDTLKYYIKTYGKTDFFNVKLNEDINIKIKANLIKVLTHNHFERHRSIRKAIFGWVRDELIEAVKTIHKEIQSETFNILISEGEDISTSSIFHYLRALIKYGANLKIAYLLNEDFLRAMCKLIDKLDFTNDFKIYCTTHIIRSLRKNEQRSIRFEKTLNKLLKDNKVVCFSTSFLELLILENTSIIYQTLYRLKEDYPEEKNINELVDNLFNHDNGGVDLRIKDFNDCYGVNKKEQLKILWKLNNNLSIKENDITENDAGAIVEQMAEIVGYKCESYGGLLLLKYQDVKNDKQTSNEYDYIIVGKAGENKNFNKCMNDCFDFNQTENDFGDYLAVQLLEGKNYIDNIDNQYKWTNYTVYYDEENKIWKGQDNEEIKDCREIKYIKEYQQINIKRMLFIRVVKQKEKQYNDNIDKANVGSAIFIFYDNKSQLNSTDHFSIHDVRFANVLRNKLIKYFKKRYNDDTFRAWVKQKEIANYTLILNHGIDNFKNMKKENIEKAKIDINHVQYLDSVFSYLINKMWLSSILHLPPEKMKVKEKLFTLKEIVDEFNNKYKQIFYFYHPNYGNNLTEQQCKQYINFNINNMYENIKVILPEGLYEEIAFELLFNIRKHIIQDRLNTEIHNVKTNLINKLNITIVVEQISSNEICLTIENNHYYSKGDKQEGNIHGLTLIKKVLTRYKYGNLKVIELRNSNIFGVKITFVRVRQ